jgi:hypothetical protein
MSAPLSDDAWPVLEALAIGLDLSRLPGGEWAFVGRRQKPDRSGVSLAVMRELFEFELISCADGEEFARLTEKNHTIVDERFTSAIGRAITWWER